MSILNNLDKFAQAGAASASNTIKISASDLHLTGAPAQVGSNEVANLLGVAYFAAGIVAVVAIIIGGIRYVGANGDSSQIQAAKNTILYAVVGLVVVILAAAITQFVLQQVTKT